MDIQNHLKQIREENTTDVIFDFDETLATLHIDWGAWGRDILDFIHRYEPGFGSPHNHREMNALVRSHGLDYRNKLKEINRTLEQQYYSGYTTNHTAMRFLKEVADVARVHLWTSNFDTTLVPVLGELGIDDLFTTTIYNNTVTYIKPDPEGFSYINRDKRPVSQFIFVGDSDSDRGAAEALGMRFLHVLDIQE